MISAFWRQNRQINQDALVPAVSGSNPAEERHRQNYRRSRQRRPFDANRQRRCSFVSKLFFSQTQKEGVRCGQVPSFGTIFQTAGFDKHRLTRKRIGMIAVLPFTAAILLTTTQTQAAANWIVETIRVWALSKGLDAATEAVLNANGGVTLTDNSPKATATFLDANWLSNEWPNNTALGKASAEDSEAGQYKVTLYCESSRIMPSGAWSNPPKPRKESFGFTTIKQKHSIPYDACKNNQHLVTPPTISAGTQRFVEDRYTYTNKIQRVVTGHGYENGFSVTYHALMPVPRVSGKKVSSLKPNPENTNSGRNCQVSKNRTTNDGTGLAGK